MPATKAGGPVFDFDLYSGRYGYESFNEGFFLPTRQKETFYAQYKAWRSSAEVTVRFPFTLSARQYNRTYNLMSVTGLSDYTMKN